jgi:RNA polymerase-interacting CarD/CdnL/TRCF family regulator
LRNSAINIRKGERVHHPQHGVGEIQSVRERSFYGSEAATYAELYFEREDLTLTLLKDDVRDSVRKLISSTKARQLLKELKDWDGKPSKQWKARANTHQAAIESGDPFAYAKVFKELCQLDANESLRAGDRAHLKQTEELLVEELANSLGKSRRQAQSMLDKAIDR